VNQQTPDREASLRELLANMQADVALLMSSASSSKAASTSSIDGAADAGAAMAAATVLPQQLQQQLAKLTQNCAELGEAVLQLELQLQQVWDTHAQQSTHSVPHTVSKCSLGTLQSCENIYTEMFATPAQQQLVRMASSSPTP
jgi:hypothetical protein